jgi:hypothetical protein
MEYSVSNADILTSYLFEKSLKSLLLAACRLYGCLGAVFGTCSIMTMVVIGFDRYNVIVKGFSGTKITPGKVTINAPSVNRNFRYVIFAQILCA